MKIVPVNVCIKQYYRAYAHIPENADPEQIRQAVINAILENGELELSPDPDIDTEEQDIVFIAPDEEGSWTEEEDESTTEILNRRDRK